MPRTALLGPDNVKITVSLPSDDRSSIISVIVIVALVSPASIVRVPLVRVKSVPEPEAVPVTA